METVQTLARRDGPRGEVVLRRRDRDGTVVEELIVNGVFAMDSAETHTERRLAEVAVAGAVVRPRVLVGGLGLGYTVAELLAVGAGHLDVVEIEHGLVEWARAGLTPTLAAAAADPRVHLVVADVAEVLAGRAQGPHGPWDAIVLDVDNGPDFLIHADNAALYGEPALTKAYAQLSEGGTLAIWCQGPAPGLRAALGRVGGHVRTHSYRRVREDRTLAYAIYTVTRPGAARPAEQE